LKRNDKFFFIKNKELEFKTFSWLFVALEGKIDNQELRFRISENIKNESSDLHQYLQNRNSNEKKNFWAIQKSEDEIWEKRAIENKPRNK